jgi:hypothetical protein
VRVRVGPVVIGNLSPGKIRTHTKEEVSGLYTVSGLARPTPGALRRSSRDRTSK